MNMREQLPVLIDELGAILLGQRGVLLCANDLFWALSQIKNR
jgi:hypothetical protein